MIEIKRKTITEPVSFSGLSLHGGQAVTVTVHPGENGIAFRYGANRYAAVPSEVTDTTRCTKLGEISTIEHLMSALAVAGITDCEVEVSGAPELPGLDGCAQAYFSKIMQMPHQALPARTFDGLFARVYEKGEAHEIAMGRGEGRWRYTFTSGDRFPGLQEFEVVLTPEVYAAEVAPARTFAFESELPALKQMGLGQGLDEQSAFAIGKARYLGTPRFADEPARHKLLDLIGDLYLAGIPPLHLSVVAERSGHTANVGAAAKLLAAVRDHLD